MTKEDILIKAFDDRQILDCNREMDTDVHYAIMDAMEEYAQQQVLKHSITSLKGKMHPMSAEEIDKQIDDLRNEWDRGF